MNRTRSNESLSSNGSSSPTEFTSDDDAATDMRSNFFAIHHKSGYNNSEKYRSELDNQKSKYRSRFDDDDQMLNYRIDVDNKPKSSYEYKCEIEKIFSNFSDSNSNNPNSTRELTKNPAHQFLNRAIANSDFDYSPKLDIDHLDSPRRIMPPRSTTDNHQLSNPFSTVSYLSKLLDCNSLVEAIALISQHRDTISNLTKIVTTYAPAYRNYNMANYDIDHSVKESFNEDFWLDREPIVTTADGNCQYHAVSISLTGSELSTPEVRLAAAVAVIDNWDWFDSILKLIDKGTVLDLVHTIARIYSWGDETTLKAIAIAIRKRIFLYTCNMGKNDYEVVNSLNKEDLIDAFREKKYRGGTGIHSYADPLPPVIPDDYIMLFHKSDHFIAVLPTTEQPTMFEPYNPTLPVL